MKDSKDAHYHPPTFMMHNKDLWATMGFATSVERSGTLDKSKTFGGNSEDNSRIAIIDVSSYKGLDTPLHDPIVP
jgi:hypothetical protein